jgi:hypothetical protein
MAVWLAGTEEGGGSIWTRSHEGGDWAVVAALKDRRLRYQFMGVSAGGEALVPDSLEEKTPQACKLVIGEQVVSPAVIEGDEYSYDLADPLNTYLGPDYWLAGHDIDAPLTFSGVGLKMITVYAPRLEFELIV